MRVKIIVPILVAAFSTVLYADNNHDKAAATAALNRLSWLIGTWQSEKKDGMGYEVWKRVSETRFDGLGLTMKGKDTAFSEMLAIEASDSGLFYIATVSHNAGPVYFRMTQQDSVTTLFENPAHDFPTRVVYRHPSADSLHARIEGVRKDKETGIDFLFVRKGGQ